MSSNEKITEKYSLENFLKDHVIIIPAMQRDYAQGRYNAEATNIRNLFISAILNAVFEEEDFSLDFTYGDSKNNDEVRYYPVDGQQRLTTLFLVYAYVLIKAKQENDKETINSLDVLQNFRFEERYKAEEYIKELLSSKVDEARLIMPELWHKSPTAEGFACSFLLISKAFEVKEKEIGEKKKSLKAKDYLERLKKITFMEIHSDLPDDVFCKINARGRALTDFEIFKAGVIRRIKDDEVSKSFVSSANNFYEKLFYFYHMEGQKGDIDRRVAISIMRIIRSWFMFLECHTYGSNKKAVITCDNLDRYIAFDDYFESINENIAELNEAYAIKTLGLFFKFLSTEDKFPDSLINLLPTRKSAKINGLDEISSEILSACITFFGKEHSEKDDLKNWMRFVCNILDNSDNSLERTKMFVSIGMAHDIKKEIKGYQIDNASALRSQFEEEQLKIDLIEKDKSWDNPIKEAENLEILDGKISVLLDIDGAIDSLDKFKKYSACLSELWNNCKESEMNTGTKFFQALIPHYMQDLPEIKIPVKFTKTGPAKDVLYKSMPDAFSGYANNLVEGKNFRKTTDDSPYWIRTLCGKDGEKLIKATCSDDTGFVSTYRGSMPVLWSKGSCTWNSYNNVILTPRNEYITDLLKTDAFELMYKKHNIISDDLLYYKEWDVYLTYEKKYHFRTEDWISEEIFLLNNENKEILSPDTGIHYCVCIKDSRSAVENAKIVIKKAENDGFSLVSGEVLK